MYGSPQGLGIVNVAMSNYSKAFKNAALMSFMLAPLVPVARRTNQYLVFDRSSQRIVDTSRSPGGRPVQLAMGYSTDNYVCNAYAAEVPIPRENEATAALLGFQLTQSATQNVMAAIHLGREAKVVSLLKSGITQSTTPSGTDLWNNAASNPIAQIEADKLEIALAGVTANTLILGPDVASAARQNPSIIERFKYTNTGGIITNEMLATAFGVQNVYEAGAVSTDGNDVGSFLWAGLVALAYVQPVTTEMDISAMKTFVDTTQGADGYEVLEYPDPYPSSKQVWVSGEMAYDIKITAQETIAVRKNVLG